MPLLLSIQAHSIPGVDLCEKRNLVPDRVCDLLLFGSSARSLEKTKRKTAPRPAEVCRGKGNPKRYDKWRELVPMAYSSLREQKMTWTTFIAGPIYEFGVYRGASMVFLRRKPQFQNTFMYGFDSFEGFPDEAEGIGTQFDWTKGGYNGGDIRQELMAMLF